MVLFLNFYIKNGNFKKFLETKSVPNIHQNAPNCTIFKNIFSTPTSKAHGFAMQISNRKKNSWSPLPNLCYAPVIVIILSLLHVLICNDTKYKHKLNLYAIHSYNIQNTNTIVH